MKHSWHEKGPWHNNWGLIERVSAEDSAASEYEKMTQKNKVTKTAQEQDVKYSPEGSSLLQISSRLGAEDILRCEGLTLLCGMSTNGYTHLGSFQHPIFILCTTCSSFLLRGFDFLFGATCFILLFIRFGVCPTFPLFCYSCLLILGRDFGTRGFRVRLRLRSHHFTL